MKIIAKRQEGELFRAFINVQSSFSVKQITFNFVRFRVYMGIHNWGTVRRRDWRTHFFIKYIPRSPRFPRYGWPKKV